MQSQMIGCQPPATRRRKRPPRPPLKWRRRQNPKVQKRQRLKHQRTNRRGNQIGASLAAPACFYPDVFFASMDPACARPEGACAGETPLGRHAHCSSQSNDTRRRRLPSSLAIFAAARNIRPNAASSAAVMCHWRWRFLFGNNQNMRRRLWRDIPKSQHKLVFIDDIGWNRFGDNFWENGAHRISFLLTNLTWPCRHRPPGFARWYKRHPARQEKRPLWRSLPACRFCRAEWHHRFGFKLIGQGGGHVGLDETGRHGIDADAARGDLLRQRFGQPDDAGFAGGVVGLTAVASQTDHAGDVTMTPRRFRIIRRVAALQHSQALRRWRWSLCQNQGLHPHNHIVKRDAGVCWRGCPPRHNRQSPAWTNGRHDRRRRHPPPLPPPRRRPLQSRRPPAAPCLRSGLIHDDGRAPRRQFQANRRPMPRLPRWPLRFCRLTLTSFPPHSKQIQLTKRYRVDLPVAIHPPSRWVQLARADQRSGCWRRTIRVGGMRRHCGHPRADSRQWRRWTVHHGRIADRTYWAVGLPVAISL